MRTGAGNLDDGEFWRKARGARRGIEALRNRGCRNFADRAAMIADQERHHRGRLMVVRAGEKGVAAFDAMDEAVEMANDSRYGLQAGVFTRDIGNAKKAGETLEFGGVLVNEVPTFRTDQMPYGGVKDSGYGSEGGPEAMEAYLNSRAVVIQNA